MRTTKRNTPYESTQDPAFFLHHNKTHRTASEAFRDADYATPIWRSQTDFEHAIDFLGGSIYGFLIVFIALGVAVWSVYYWVVSRFAM